MRRILVVLALCAVLAVPAPASLIGDMIDARWQFPPSSFDVTDTLLVGPGIETASWAGTSATLDIGASTIAVDFTDTNFNALAAGVNWTFSDLDWVGSPGHIVFVSVSTNWVGWDDNYVTFGDDWIDINFQNAVGYNAARDEFEITIEAIHDPIPEPMTLSLLGMGIAGLAARRRFLA